MFGIKVLTLQPKPINETTIMNENIDLTKILKDCPKGTKLYSSVYGEVYFKEIRSDDEYSIITTNGDYNFTFTKEGLYRVDADGECILFPSREQRDWSKFTAPWYKKDKFDPNTLQPFDGVLVRDRDDNIWKCGFFSHIGDEYNRFSCITITSCYRCCIPYNDETKHLVGTTEEAPEYYRYWED